MWVRLWRGVVFSLHLKASTARVRESLRNHDGVHPIRRFIALLPDLPSLLSELGRA